MGFKDIEARRIYNRNWYAKKVVENPQFWRTYAPKRLVHTTCLACGKPFEGRSDRKTCSKSCANYLANKTRPKRPDNPKPWLADAGSEAKGTVNAQGYRMVYRPDHPRQDKNRSVQEHRVVMETLMNRLLLPHERVHHKNGDKLDNRAENLELWTVSHPSGQRVIDKVLWAKELLALYEPEALAIV